MQYSPKLKQAAEELKAVMKKYDIGGIFIIHTPGFSEFVNVLDPSYSCIHTNGDEVRFRSKLADYGGDKEAWQKKTTESLNLLQGIVECGGRVILPLMDLEEALSKQMDAESNGGSFTSHTAQNN